MPGLQIFNRRWEIGSDDFVFPQVTEAIFRLLWFVIALIIIFFVHFDEWTQSKCPENAGDDRVYLLGLLVLNALLIVVCFCTAYISGKGTILNQYPRRHVCYLIYSRIPLFVFEFVWNICGSIWVYYSSNLEGCEPYVTSGAKITMALGWIMVFLFLLSIFVVFDPMGALRHANRIIIHDREKQAWIHRLRILCICATADRYSKSAFANVADFLSDLFSDTDLVLTDVCAGLLLWAYQPEFPVSNSQYPVADSVLPQPPEWMNIQLASRMMKFALAVYYCRFKQRCDILRKTGCCRSDQVLVGNFNMTAFLKTAGIQETDLFYVSFHDDIYQVPFVVCADPKSRSIIVAIRGTFSLRDVVTDLCVRDECLTLDGENYQVHSGMYEAAKHVKSTLDSQNVLDQLFLLYPDYNLVVTGHSLGAGVAAILGLLFRLDKYPSVRCFAFEPPGCVVNEDCVPLTRDFIFSTAVGDDLVPRLSYQSMERLKKNIVDIVEHCEIPKYKILLKGCFKLLSRSPFANAHRKQRKYAEDTELPPLNPSPKIVEDGRTLSLPLGLTDKRVNLVVPGRIMHLTNVESQYKASWSDYRKFTNVKLSNSMLTDHSSLRVAKVLNGVAVLKENR